MDKFKLWPPQLQALRDYGASLDASNGDLEIGFGGDLVEVAKVLKKLPPCVDMSDLDLLAILRQVANSLTKRFPNIKGLLSNPENAQVLDAYVKTFADLLESLPRTYSVSFQITPFTRPLSGAVELCGDASLVFDVRYVEEHSGGLLMPAVKRREVPSAELKFVIVGLATYSSDSPAVSDAILLTKLCLFLMEVQGFTARRWLGFASHQSSASVRDLADNNSWQVRLPRGLVEALSQTAINETNLRIYRGKTLIGGSPQAPSTEAEFLEAMNDSITLTKDFLKARDSGDNKRITAAIEWYQDSIYSDDQTMAYLMACIGLEALFNLDGEYLKDMSNRLADRYSFLLGKGGEDRKRLEKDYRGVLELRGKLVHARERRLLPKDRDKLGQVRRMLKESIRHELGIGPTRGMQL